MQNTYETIIGLEVHVQLSTQSKAFCADDASFSTDPNTHISVISLGHPGTLPRMNKEQIAYAVRLGLALNSKINLENRFDRKNYFYADLPKGYQITQDRLPICVGGSLDITVGETTKTIRIHHIHMEEDAGKSIHDEHSPYSFIDLNRAGVPLLEIVTEPDLRSAEEVDAFMSAMRQLVRYLDICDGNMEQGSMRCDCNVSIRPEGADYLNERCEIKNLNSMRYARQAIIYEVARQTKVINSGGKVAQQTLNFDPETGVTTPIRTKENANDYRYFPEPDLPPVILTEEYIVGIKEQLPTLPWVLKQTFIKDYGLSDYDATILTEELELAQFYQNLIQHTKDYKAAANLIINKVKPQLEQDDLTYSAFPLSAQQLADFIDLIASDKVSNSMAYQRVFPALMDAPTKSPLEVAKSLNLIQSSDSSFLEEVIANVIAANPDKLKAYKKGKKGLLGFFMGQVMKQSKGKANPKIANQLLQKALDE